MNKIILISFLLLSFSIQAQDLLNERIRSVSARKKSIYFDSGIFHNGNLKKTKSILREIRHSYVSSRGYERVVFDFSTELPPRIYGNISGKNKKLYIDFFNTSLKDEFASFGNSKFVKEINFFPIDKGMLSLEITFKKKVNSDVFYLSSPGRLVIDLKL